MNIEQSRFSQAQVLIAALFTVMATGAMPKSFPCDEQDQPIYISAKPKRVVSLARRFPQLRSTPRRINRIEIQIDTRLFDVRNFLENRFGLRWKDLRAFYLLELEVLPSTVLRALAMEMAKGEQDVAQMLLDSRATQGLHAASYSVCKQYSTIPGLVTSLWRISGNPDRIWFALRDEMTRIDIDVAAQSQVVSL